MDIHIHGNPGSAAGRKFFGPSYYRLCDMNCSKVRIHLPEVYWLESLTQNVYVCSASKRKWSATPHRRRDCFISPIWTRWLHLTWQPYRQLLVSTYLMTSRWFTSSKYKEINFGRRYALQHSCWMVQGSLSWPLWVDATDLCCLRDLMMMMMMMMMMEWRIFSANTRCSQSCTLKMRTH